MLTLEILQSSSMKQPLQWKEGKIFKVLFTITPTNVDSPGNANPYVPGGDLLDLTQLVNLAGGAPGATLPTFELIPKVVIQSQPNAPGPATLQEYRFCAGTNLTNGTMQVMPSTTPQIELAAGNYPAAVLADVIVGEAYFVMP